MRYLSRVWIGVGAWCVWPQEAHAGLIRGVQTVVMGVLQPVLGVLVGTAKGAPVIGTVQGALAGLAQGVAMVGSGTLEVAGSAIPIAKAAVPYLLPFLL